MVIGYIESQLLEKPLDPKKMQIALTGFLEKNTAAFMSNLWTLLLSAQTNDFGIPEEFLEKKKEELRLKREEAAKVEADMLAKTMGQEASQREHAEVEVANKAALQQQLLLLQKQQQQQQQQAGSKPRSSSLGGGGCDGGGHVSSSSRRATIPSCGDA